MSAVGWVTTVVVGIIIVGGVVVGVSSVPDLRRYLKMRNM
jgi:hypothetical protein